MKEGWTLSDESRLILKQCRTIYWIESSISFDMTFFSGVQELYFRQTTIPPNSSFSGVKKLILDDVKNLQNITSAGNDLKWLKVIYPHTFDVSSNILLSLNHLEFVDHPFLSNLQFLHSHQYLTHLTLIHCNRLMNVDDLITCSALQSVVIHQCSRLRTIDGLIHIPNIEIINCPSLKHIPLFSNKVKKIKLSVFKFKDHKECEYLSGIEEGYFDECNITSCSFLLSNNEEDGSMIQNQSKCKSFKFYSCLQLSDVSALHSLQSLTLWGCPSLDDISALGRVPDLRITRCPVTNLEGLGKGNRHVELSDCHNIPSFSSLQSVYSVKLSYCSSFKDVNDVKDTTYLTLEKCSIHVNDISMLSKVRRLELNSCPGIITIPHLPMLREILIENCSRLECISGLEGVQQVSIIRCHEIKDYSPLHASREVVLKMQKIDNLEELISLLKNVHRVEVLILNDYIKKVYYEGVELL
eukprot:gene12378-13531_t